MSEKGVARKKTIDKITSYFRVGTWSCVCVCVQCGRFFLSEARRIAAKLSLLQDSSLALTDDYLQFLFCKQACARNFRRQKSQMFQQR